MDMVHGGRLVAAELKRHDITHLFTLCGGHIQAIYDGCVDEGIRVVDVRHEQTAGHAADGYARMTGRPGVCAVTAGPGVTDVVTAVANAQRAQVPLVCLGGAGPNILRNMGSLQDMDHVALMRSITKWSTSVGDTSRIGDTIDSALRTAQAGVPGPVFVELPLDVLMNMGDLHARQQLPPPVLPARPFPDRAGVERAATLLEHAARPCIVLGAQVRWSSAFDRLAAILTQLGIPVFLSGMARGRLPGNHPLLYSKARRLALATSDLVFVLGTPFDFRLDYGRHPTFSEQAKVVQVDLDAQALGQNRPIDVGICADIGVFLEELARHAASFSTQTEERTRPWKASLLAEESRRRAKMDAEIASASSPPNPLRVCAEIGKRLGSTDVVIGDGGDFVATAANVLSFDPSQIWMDPGPLGTLGVGPGYAMAAKLARPDANVVIVYGDGSFGLHALEFEAMARQGLPIIAVIGNDAGWTQIRRGQVDMFGHERAVATALAYTRYEKVVEACGGVGFWVETVDALGPALDEAFAAKVPVCVNVKLSGSDFRKGALSV